MNYPRKVPFRYALITKNKDEVIKYLLGYHENLDLELFNETYFLYEYDKDSSEEHYLE